jgi:hypothetical protein
VLAAGAAVILEQLWLKVLVRVWRFVKYGERHVQADPVLLEIAEQFKPNSGASLYDQVCAIRRTAQRNSDAIQEIDNKIDVFILGMQMGGGRFNDPPFSEPSGPTPPPPRTRGRKIAPE